MIDIKKLTQQKNELKELWDYLSFEIDFPEKEVRRWLLEHGKDQVQAAIELLAKREHDVTDPIKYLGKVLHNSKLQNMTVEERQERISTLSAMAGKARAAKEHQAKVAAIRQEFAEVCKDSAASPLYSAEIRSGLSQSALDVGFGVGSGLDVGVVPVSGEGEEIKPPAAAAASRLSSQAKEESKSKTQTPKPEPTPTAVRSVPANLEAKATPKPKTIKTAMGARPKPEGFDSWTNVERTEWLACTCGSDMRQDSDGYRYLIHKTECSVDNQGRIKGQSKPEAKAAAATGTELGTVDDLTGDWITTRDGYRIRGL